MDIETILYLLLIEKEIICTTNKLRFEDKFLKLTFAKTLREEQRNKLESFVYYG